MKILVIRNIPKHLEDSSTMKLEKFFLNQLNKNNEIKTHDLYRDNRVPRMNVELLNDVILKVDKSTFSSNEQKLMNQKIEIAKEIKWANKIIIVTPFWTGFFPSLLKDWIDLIPVEKITYDINKEEGTMAGHHGGEILMIQSMGADKDKNSINYGWKLIEANFKFYGFKKIRNITQMGTALKGEKNEDKALKKLSFVAKEWNNE